jgi:hypothetical protein
MFPDGYADASRQAPGYLGQIGFHCAKDCAKENAGSSPKTSRAYHLTFLSFRPKVLI